MQDAFYPAAPEAPAEPLDFLASLSDKIEGFFYRCLNDRDYTMLRTSSGFDRMLGRSSADFVLKRRSFADLVHPDDLANLAAAMDDAIADKGRWRVRYRLRRMDESYAPVLDTGGGVFDPETGALRYLDGVVLDISQLR